MSIKINLDLTPAFKDLWQGDYREYIYYGGRYGGKNYAISQFLCTQALRRKTRILVLREFETSSRASVYKDIQDFFENHELEYRIGELDLEIKRYYANEKLIKYKATRIVLEFNKSEFIFAGVNDNVVDSLKGLKDINFCWIDEADFLTQYSYNKLKPTIRAQGSALIYSFNPEKSDSFLYQKAITNKDPRCFVKKITAAKYDEVSGKWICGDNPFLNDTILADINSDFLSMTPQIFNFVHLGEPYDAEDGNVINTDIIGYFNDTTPLRYDKLIMTADTAYSKKESADYSVVAIFGSLDNEIHLLRILRGHWDFNELKEQVVGAYEWVWQRFFQHCDAVLIEKKASGISLLQELQRATNLPIKEVVPKSDKFTRISSVLGEFARLRLPISKDNPLNSWISPYLAELRAFRADLAHLHDDQVDATYYGLEYFKNSSVDWSKFL